MPTRELLDTDTDKRYVPRNKRGTSFVESDDVGRSLAADRRKVPKPKSKSGTATKAIRRGLSPNPKPGAEPPAMQLVGKAPLGSLPAKHRQSAAAR
jgi:hypothetical protein